MASILFLLGSPGLDSRPFLMVMTLPPYTHVHMYTHIQIDKKYACGIPIFHVEVIRKKKCNWAKYGVVVVQLLSRVHLFVTPWTAACQASLSSTISQSLLKLMSIESVMPSNHLILCRPLLLLPSIFPSIRVFSNASALPTRWPKYWSFSFSISPSNEYSGLISLWIDWFDG